MSTWKTVHALERNKVYLVQRRGEKGMFDMALIPQVRERNGVQQLCYFNGERGHMLEGKMLSASDDKLIFEWSWRGDAYSAARVYGVLTLRPMTMAEFNAYLRPQIDPHRRFINDAEDLSSYMLRRVPRC